MKLIWHGCLFKFGFRYIEMTDDVGDTYKISLTRRLDDPLAIELLERNKISKISRLEQFMNELNQK